MVAKNHSGYPAGSVTLLSEKQIGSFTFDEDSDNPSVAGPLIYIVVPDIIQLAVNSTNPSSGIAIESLTGHYGTTPYNKVSLVPETRITLKAPANAWKWR